MTKKNKEKARPDVQFDTGGGAYDGGGFWVVVK